MADRTYDWLRGLLAEGAQTRIRVSPDHENSADEWWIAARESTNAPAGIRPLLDGGNSVLLPVSEALEVLRWASALPGWDDGPEYARYALLFNEEDEE